MPQTFAKGDFWSHYGNGNNGRQVLAYKDYFTGRTTPFSFPVDINCTTEAVFFAIQSWSGVYDSWFYLHAVNIYVDVNY